MDETNLHQARILIVDDDVSHVCLLMNFLDRLGYKNLKSITDSRKIFAEIREFRPDVILLDLMMPQLDGFQILERFKAQQSDETFIPVLVLTGEPTYQNKRKALAAGATDLLQKPFDPSEIVMRIRNLVQGRFFRMEIQTQKHELEKRVAERTHELEQALAELRETQRQIVQQERLRAFGEMAGGVVHDFNNALMSVVGYSDWLLKEPAMLDDKKTVREYLEIIRASGNEASQVIGRLRDFYRSREDGEVHELVDINKLMEEMVPLTQPKWKDEALASGRIITLVLDLEKLPLISANPIELREVGANLIFNAVDAMPNGGTITLRTRHTEDTVMIEFADTGTGMSREVRDRCLEPFFTTKGDNGTGLGLSIVFGIIKRHEGTLDIESEEGKGVTFRVRLPFKTESLEGKKEPAMLTRTLNVLIVDDDPTALDLVSKYLQVDGHRVTEAANGADALTKYKADPFDLVVVDQGMPGMSGTELAGAIRTLRDNQPMIMLTGYKDPSLYADAAQSGIGTVILKPVVQSELRRALSTVIR